MHEDPECYEKWEFCRVECAECNRLDALDTRPREVVVGDGIQRAFAFLKAEGYL